MPIFQIALPILLILWLVIAPLPGRARLIHVAMTFCLLATIILAGQWLWPSAYAPLGLLALLLIAILFGRRRTVDRQRNRLWPAVLASLVTFAAAIAAAGLVTARLRPATVTDIAAPFAAAMVITEGGARQIINRHRAVMDADSPSLLAWQGTAFAISLLPADGLGRIVATPQPVLAPCAGRVTAQGEDQRIGRFVQIDCAGTVVVVSELSTIDAAGQLTMGQSIGTASTLTLHAQTPGTSTHPFSGTPRWISLNGTFATRGWVLRP